MSRQVREGNPPRLSRRAVLAAAGALPIGRARATPDANRRGSLRGIDSADVVGSYHRRALHELPDAALVDAAAEIVARPEEQTASFTLHAPLELLARSGLLPLVDARHRERARMQIVASAATYEAEAELLARPPKPPRFRDRAAAVQHLRAAFEGSDPDGFEAGALGFAAQFGAPAAAEALLATMLPTLTAACHAHIGLWLLLKHGGGDVRRCDLLRGALRKLAAEPTGRLGSFGGMDMRGNKPMRLSPARLGEEIAAKLAALPPATAPARGGIRGIMEAGERSGAIDRLFRETIDSHLGPESVRAGFTAITRTAAQLCLQHGETDAHRLTLAQAAAGLAESVGGGHGKLALASALVWITSYRLLGEPALDPAFVPRKPSTNLPFEEALVRGAQVAASRFWHAEPGERPAMARVLATEASIRGSQHLVKYTRACLDMCALDPPATRLYLAAAAAVNGKAARKRPRNTLAQLPPGPRN